MSICGTVKKYRNTNDKKNCDKKQTSYPCGGIKFFDEVISKQYEKQDKTEKKHAYNKTADEGRRFIVFYFKFH